MASGWVQTLTSWAWRGGTALWMAAIATSAPAQVGAGRIDALASQGAQVVRDPTGKNIRFVGGSAQLRALGPRLVAGTDAVAQAQAHLNALGPDLGLPNAAQQTRLLRSTATPAGTRVVRFEQVHQGVPVFGSAFVVNTDGSGNLLALAAHASNVGALGTTPTVAAAAAQATALAVTSKAHALPAAAFQAGDGKLVVYDPALLSRAGNEPRLAWRVTVRPVAVRPVRQEVLVDAQTGAVLLSFNNLAHARNRVTSDANFTSTLPGTLLCTEGQANCTNGVNADADKAHRYIGDVHQFYFSRFARDSYDGLGSALQSTVRYCETPGANCTFLNAFWNGQRMVYGPNMVADDVVAHEMTHAVTEHESGLVYLGEPGAINESLSDIFGEFVDQTNGQGNDVAGVRWQMGEDLTAMGVIRNMADPTLYGDPDRKGSPNWYTGPEDSIGVHRNSGVGNKAAYLMTDGGSFNGRTVAALGLEKVARIYYEAQVALLAPTSSYNDLAAALYQACLNVVGQAGITTADCTQVRNATDAVEMPLNAVTAALSCPAGTVRQELGLHTNFAGAPTGTLVNVSSATGWYYVTWWYRTAPNGGLGWHPQASGLDASKVYRINTPVVAGDRFGFYHQFNTELGYDGSVVEYSVNGGVTWADASALPRQGQGYNATLSAGSALAGRSAFTGSMPVLVSTSYDLSALAGQTVMFRFRTATDGSVAYDGWFLDDITHYRCVSGSTVAFQSASYSVGETGTNTLVSVVRTGTATLPASITWTTANGSAVAGSDFGTAGSVSQRSGTLSWAAGDTTAKTISVGPVGATVPVLDDGLIEGNESFGIVLSNPVGATIGSTGSTTVTIVDNDSLIGFAANALTVSEDGSNGVLTVQRTGALGSAASVTWRTVNGTALAGQDFGSAGSATQRTGTLTWAAGDGSARTITVGPVAATGSHIPVINDAVIEGPETFAVQLSSTSTGVTIGTAEAVVTIVSDDRGIAMATGAQAVSEDVGTAQVMVTRSGSSSGAMSVNYATANGTALAGQHYQTTSGTLSWADGETAAKAISVPIVDNTQVNTARTFSVTLSGPVGGTLGTPAATTVTIADNDNTLQLSAATATVTEGQAAVTLTVTRLGGAGSAASVQWRTVNGTATSGSDFGAAGVASAVTGVLNWAAGDATAKTISIPILDDAVVESPESFVVELFSPSGTGANLGTLTSATVTVTDNDSGVVFSAPSYVVAESGVSVTLTVNRIGPPTAAASVTWTTGNGSAVAGQDFGTAGSATQRTGVLSWAAGAGGARTIVIPILSDTAAEGTESFNVTLSNPSAGLIIGGSATASVVIVDDEVPAESTVSFGAPKYTVAEGAGQVTLVLNRVGNATLPVSVKFATAAGTATAASDFVTQTGTVSWAAGDASPKSIVVAIVNDALAEVPESFSVTLSAPSPGLALGAQAAASVLILDDDELFPPAGQLPAGWIVPAGASAGWQVSFEPGAAVGVASLRSQTIGDGGTAQVQVARSFVAGSISFRVKVSSEAGFDALRFYIDGVKVGEWSGTANATWQTVTLPLTAGSHTLRWSYEKDGSGSVGQDAAWLDAVVLPPAP